MLQKIRVLYAVRGPLLVVGHLAMCLTLGSRGGEFTPPVGAPGCSRGGGLRGGTSEGILAGHGRTEVFQREYVEISPLEREARLARQRAGSLPPSRVQSWERLPHCWQIVYNEKDDGTTGFRNMGLLNRCRVESCPRV